MRIGFACILVNNIKRMNGETMHVTEPRYKMGTVQIKHVKDLTSKERKEKVWKKAVANLTALSNILSVISEMETVYRMYRISSDLLPLYDHPEYGPECYGDRPELNAMLAKLGETIREFDIRVSVHPSQFITLFSHRHDVIEKSLHHVKLWVGAFTSMGLNPDDHGVTIVMHANGQSTDFPRIALPIKDWIGLENDEHKAGFDKVLYNCERYGIRMVLDVHHYWCERGEHFGLVKREVDRVIRTWPDEQRPKMHISSSRGTESRREICAHADFISYNDSTLHWQLAYKFDIMVEAKAKNVASWAFASYVLEQTGYFKDD